MDSTYDLATGGPTRRAVRVRVLTAMAAMALVVAAFLLLQRPAEAAVAPQFGDFICGLLESLFASFQGSPFFGFIEPILEGLLGAFGCTISGG